MNHEFKNKIKARLYEQLLNEIWDDDDPVYVPPNQIRPGGQQVIPPGPPSPGIQPWRPPPPPGMEVNPSGGTPDGGYNPSKLPYRPSGPDQAFPKPWIRDRLRPWQDIFGRPLPWDPSKSGPTWPSRLA
jgi:hypothetical protein